MIQELCRLITRKITPRVIGDVTPYLSKYLLLGKTHGGRHVHLHCFHRSDAHQKLHNHPWKYSFAIILYGGYREEREREDGMIVTYERTPGSIVFIRDSTFHRIDLLKDECWTLFFNSKVTGEQWGYKDKVTRKFTANS